MTLAVGITIAAAASLLVVLVLFTRASRGQTQSVSLALAVRYIGLPQPRSRFWFLFALLPGVQFLMFQLVDRAVRSTALDRFPTPSVGRVGLFVLLGLMLLAQMFVVGYWVRRATGPSEGAFHLAFVVLLSLVLALALGWAGVAIAFVTVSDSLNRKLHRATVICVGVTLLLLQLALLWLYRTDPHVLSAHAQWARALGNAKWICAVSTVGYVVFIVAFRRLTIFTTLSVYGMFLGCAALVIVLSVMSGFEADIKHKILGTHAHVVVTKPDEAFTDWSERLAALQQLPGVLAITPSLSGEAMLASSNNRSTAIVNGIDPATIGHVTDLDHDMEVGALDSLAHPESIRDLEPPPSDDDDDDLRVDLDKSAKKTPKVKAEPPKPTAAELAERARRAPPGIILGRELAKTMRVYLGDDVSLISPSGGIGPGGSTPKSRPYRVAGIFYSGMFEYDSKFVYITLDSAQKLFDQPDEVTDLEIKVPNPDDTDPVMAKIHEALGKGYDVDDWRSLNRSLFSALALEKVVMFVFLSFIILVAAFSIVANGQMIATRKIAEIAILKSMGATDGVIGRAFLWIGVVIGSLGVLGGVTGGIVGAMALRKWGYALDPDVFYLTALPVHLEPHEIVVIGIAGMIVTVLATLYPAYAASRMQPVEGLREGGR